MLAEKPDCVAGHIGLELANVGSSYVLEIRNNCSWLERQPDDRDHSRLSCKKAGAMPLARPKLATREFDISEFESCMPGRWGIEAQHPDEFLTHQFHLSQPAFLQAVKTVRVRLKNPPKSVEDYLDTIRADSKV